MSSVVAKAITDLIAGSRWCNFYYLLCHGRKTKYKSSKYKVGFSLCLPSRRRITDPRWIPRARISPSSVNTFPIVRRWYTPYSIPRRFSRRKEFAKFHRKFNRKTLPEGEDEAPRFTRARTRENARSREDHFPHFVFRRCSRVRATNARRMRTIHHALLLIRS